VPAEHHLTLLEKTPNLTFSLGRQFKKGIPNLQGKTTVFINKCPLLKYKAFFRYL